MNSNFNSTKYELLIYTITSMIDGKNTKKLKTLINFVITIINRLLNKQNL